MKTGKTEKITMQEPVLVATSDVGENRWGFHQFPAISRLPDGRVLLMFANAEDASETHGYPAPCYISDNEGLSWSTRQDDDFQPARPHCTVSKVFNGEYLAVPPVPYLDIEEQCIRLPQPVSIGNTYGTVYHYQWCDLPASAQEYFRHIPARRWRPDGNGWNPDTIEYDTEGLRAWRREGSRLLPRTFFERSLLRYKGELFYADYRARFRREDGAPATKGFTSLMVSSDNGKTFKRRATVAMDPEDKDLMGEPQLAITRDDRLVCVIRRTDQNQKPMCITWSSDSGHTWTDPQPLFEFGVWPCILLLENGWMVLSYGRPGVHLAFDPAGTGESWAYQHPLIEGDPSQITAHSCGYTSLLPVGKNSFLIAYSDFQYRDTEGHPCKAILTRRIDIEKVR